MIALLFGITIFKAIAMTTTIGAGGAGGVFIPTMVMGSALGNVVAKVINNLGLGFSVSESNFTLIGMSGLIGWGDPRTIDGHIPYSGNYGRVSAFCALDDYCCHFIFDHQERARLYHLHQRTRQNRCLIVTQ